MIKIGDAVVVRSDETGTIWHEFMGRVGVVIAYAKRLHYPAVKVMLADGIAEFDYDELEILKNRM